MVEGDLAIDAKLGIERLCLVVDEKAASPLAHPRRAGDDDERNALGIRRRDRVDQVEGTGAVGDGGDAQSAVDARGGVRRKAHRRLMAQAIKGQHPRFLDDLEKGQREIPGNAENLARAACLQRVEKGLGDVQGVCLFSTWVYTPPTIAF